MSNVGKSILSAGLCRVFAQDGYRVAPFKSQNMALNSFVTEEGLEMSRAQVLQAEAAGVKPDVRMNPILLKPTGDMGSQVIVNGEVRGDYRAVDYFKMKRSLIPEIQKAYESLASEYDIIVIEGAGSPAEINLREDDIVNMGLAQLLDAPVILVGDIDPGGVFAQLYGTMELLAPDERARVIGTIINKFRGDIELLRPGLSQIEELTHVPVLGVMPYLDINLDGEDSLSLAASVSKASASLDIVVIRLPHISNYTDIAPLTLHPAIGVRYVDRPDEIGLPDMLILPGTKNTMDDMMWLKKTGLYDAIEKAYDTGVFVLGICGGYQMLGETLSDPDGTEGGMVSGEVRGLGLLPVTTVFTDKKTRMQCEAHCSDAIGDARIRGYQIHTGRTTHTADGYKPFSIIDKAWGMDTPEAVEDGCIWHNAAGTYMHGLFDTGELTSVLADALLVKKGEKPMGIFVPPYSASRERSLDILTDAICNNIDIEKIYEEIFSWQKQ